MESTYGAREHPPSEDASQALCRIVNSAIERGGKIIIPAFAVERTQQIIYRLHQNIASGCIPPIPVYVDSPLAVDATGVFRLHPDAFRPEIYQQLFEREHPFGFDQLHFTRQRSQSMELNTKPGPMIIISASGMCEGGRVLHHLRNHITNPATTVLFVGFCAEHTLGARLLAGAKEINILGESFKVRATIEQLGYFSGHAGRSELIDYFKKTGGTKKFTFLIHGEPDQCAGLADALAELHLHRKIHIPQQEQTFSL
jgi:metallo-beta-lactamase family protein